jgi:uroporphyrinogen decarboxylase
MTSRERILRMFEHKDADRIPISDRPWGQDTIERWKTEGMPANADYQDYFGFDKLIRFDIDNSPRFEQKTLEVTPEYTIYTTAWGETRKSWRHMTSTPQSIDFIVKTPDDWRRAKARMSPDRDRIQWAHLRARVVPGDVHPSARYLTGAARDGLGRGLHVRRLALARRYGVQG